MPSKKGMIVLMGSGELTATMVEVHKELLGRLAAAPRAVFLDTPAGFQLNVDQISEKAQDYFQSHVQQTLEIASFKSNETVSPFDAEQAYQTLRAADYILIGPGSPTYAVRQWMPSAIPKILTDRIEDGGCLVAASAAALTVGRFTLPVYEIYKVGQELHWVDGMDLLKHFGFNLVVVPHWNNAEGGTHDTRFCFMGKPRFEQLVAALPPDVSILGLDEHTACIFDFESNQASIKGIGRVILQRSGQQMVFRSADRFSLDVLMGTDDGGHWQQVSEALPETQATATDDGDAFWDHIHQLENDFHHGIKTHEAQKTTNALLELDRTIWQAQQDLENAESVIQARDTLRELIAILGTRLAAAPRSETDCLAPIVEQLLRVREAFRQRKQFEEADAIRDSLQRANIVIEDDKEGSRWRLSS
ncbi:MAG: Type 1 glutamine amidotransferase-like domain-containing protein [Deltaproteobacteria bacterium]|jgi:peptidase E|nr:Type 1 glutamine amidotransferase-like domain-containing protein [Deltaproteobacteria bacterium]